MGIYRELHGRGLGRKLVEEVVLFLTNENKRFLTVKTLGDSFPDDAYQRTKEFYKAMGFYPLEESDAIWGPDSPCLILVKPLGSK